MPYPFFGYPTNVPSDLITNAVAVAAGGNNGVALRKNATVEGWGDPNSGVTNVPAGLSNVVAVATGGESGLALQENGNVVIWGESTLTNIPAGIAGVKAISGGFDHNIVVESGILDPVIFTQPTDQYAPLSSNVIFSAAGLGVAGVTYQWQSNGMDITGATGATLTLSNVVAADQATYDVIVTTDGASTTSSGATFTLVVAPQIGSTSPTNTGLMWLNYGTMLSVDITNAGQLDYPITYGWQLNGTSLADYSASYPSTNFSLTPNIEGAYTVGITNVAGGTNLTWNIRLALPGMVEAWGSDGSGECNRPATLTNVAGIAAGEYQSVAITDAGTVAQWGQYSNNGALYSVTNTSVATQPPTTGVVAVAAGLGQALALTTSNTVIAWGMTSAPGPTIPTGVQTNGISAIACGSQFDLALSNGTVVAWGNNSSNQTSVPSNLSNVIAIAAGAYHGLALQSNGTVVAWGYNGYYQTNVPANLTNVVAVAAGDEHSLALQSNGIVVAWGNTNSGQCNVPTGLSNVTAIAAGSAHSVALLNNGTLVEWGANNSNQVTIPGEFPSIITGGTLSPENITNIPIVVKQIAAGGNQTMASIFSPLVQYPINVSKDLLLIYNTNSLNSSNVCQYYLTHRPMMGNANLLGIGCTTGETFLPSDYATNFVPQITNWLNINPTKRPQYVILFQDIPSRVNTQTNTGNYYGTQSPSVQYQLHYWCSTNWFPFVTAINMNGTNGAADCTNYINKLVFFGSNYSPGQLLISARAGRYTNTNWYFDYTGDPGYEYGPYAINAQYGVKNVDPAATVIGTTGTNLAGIYNFTTNATNVAGYFTAGWDGGLGDGNMFVDNTVRFFGQSGWYIMDTIDSYNGQRYSGQAGFLSWFSTNSLGGTNYSNTPVGAVTTVDEPGIPGKVNSAEYYGDWAAGKSFAIAVWDAESQIPSGEGSFVSGGLYFQSTGDPFVKQ
jgi:alpha-tubulin suppressor-like RCC1 family protein